MKIARYIPREDDDEQAHVNPTEQAKLLFEITLLQRHDEAHKANSVKHEADHTVVGSEWKELGIGENDMLERASEQTSLQRPSLP